MSGAPGSSNRQFTVRKMQHEIFLQEKKVDSELTYKRGSVHPS